MRAVRIAIILSLVAAAVGPATARAEVEVGGFVGAHFFSADNELGRFDDGPANLAPQHMVLGGFRLAYLPISRLGFEVEAAIIPTYTRGSTNPATPVIAYRGHVIFNILTGRVRPFILAGGGGSSMISTDRRVVDTDADPELHVGAGVRVDIGKNWGIRGDFRVYFPPSVGTATFTEDYEFQIGFYGRFAMGQKVAEKVVDKGPPDTDGDGVVDSADHCPSEPGPRENNGCPDRDSDGDGIVDRLDRCPFEKGTQEGAGCPDRDSDGDGLTDKEDRCPAVAGVRINQGCPDIDTDGDGLVDRLDKCPNEPETRNFYKDDDGCPDEIPAEVKKFTGVIKGINFVVNKAEITHDSFPLLDEAVKVLHDNPSVKMEISGHTDTSGDFSYNEKLSQQRADAVRIYFEFKGIDPSRLRSIGFGPSRPVETNATLEGRRKNRRVEFKLSE